jgi:hypothetical protein
MSDWWAAVHFLRPQWLWLLLAAPVIYLSLRFRDDVRSRWKRYIDPELLEAALAFASRPHDLAAHPYRSRRHGWPYLEARTASFHRG